MARLGVSIHQFGWVKAGQHRCPVAGSVYNDCCESLTANESAIGGGGSIGAGL